MIVGTVDEFGRALIWLSLQRGPQEVAVEIQAWIDTGFTGDLVLSLDLIRQLSLKKVSNVDARLADGSVGSYDVFRGWTTWFGGNRKIEVIEGSASVPLLGVGLLVNRKLTIDYVSHDVQIE